MDASKGTSGDGGRPRPYAEHFDTSEQPRSGSDLTRLDNCCRCPMEPNGRGWTADGNHGRTEILSRAGRNSRLVKRTSRARLRRASKHEFSVRPTFRNLAQAMCPLHVQP